jgi:tRNA-2-methylthio-N6-dimethylallyladenosine synthase
MDTKQNVAAIDANKLIALDKGKNSRKLYIETYGCQMNVNDSEVVAAVLASGGFSMTEKMEEADLILVNTCSIRDNAEQRVRGRLDIFRLQKKRKPHLLVGVIGCMAERLKEQLLEQEKMVDIVAGPDSYRFLPQLVQTAMGGEKAVNVMLSAEETYADIAPVRMDENHVSAFIAIMRGCNNFCTYCVVPYTRGRERSRNPQTIVNEAKDVFEKGYREVTLLGQNVNSFHWNENGENVDFPTLMAMVAQISPLLRVRFATSHPKDLSDKLLETIASYSNICKSIHLPAQSGSTRMLKLMNRKYTREDYLQRIAAIRRIVPEASISTDIIAGFCTETDEDHADTLSLIREVGYDSAFMFQYSERPDTKAAKDMKDDIPEEVKNKRLSEIIELQQSMSHQLKKQAVGKVFEVLIEGVSKKKAEELSGRTSQNSTVVFPGKHYKIGDYVNVRITSCTPATLIGEIVD